MSPLSIPIQTITPVVYIDITKSILKLTERVWQVTLKYFGLIQAGGVVGFGAQEYCLGYLSSVWNQKSIVPNLCDKEKIEELTAVKYIQVIQTEQYGSHGLLYLGSGVLCSLGEMEAVNWLNLEGVGPSLLKSGWTLFLFANLFSLEQNIKLFYEATRINGTLGHRLRVTAILGMINNLGYVLGTLLSFYQGMEVIAISLAMLAIMAGTLKFFCDFFLISLPEISDCPDDVSKEISTNNI